MEYKVQNGVLISIIIPIYNGGKYIKDIYNNIMSQTYRPIELILVNDGSTDCSKALLDDILRMHDSQTLVQVKVIHKENGGIANARNTGLLDSSGKYVMFMDQDDWIEDRCVETLADAAFLYNADLIIGGFNKISETGKIEETWNLDSQLSWSKFRITAPWGRLFKKEIIDKGRITFFDTKISEDLYFNILFISCADRVEAVPYVGYNWRQDCSSESHANWSKMSDDRNPLKMLTELHKKMGNSSLIDKEEMTFFFTKYLIWYLLFSSKGARYQKVKERAEEIFSWLNANYPDFSKYAWKAVVFPQGELLKVRVCVALMLFMERMGIIKMFLKIYSNL